MQETVFAMQLTNRDGEQIILEKAEAGGVILRLNGDEFWIDDVAAFVAAITRF